MKAFSFFNRLLGGALPDFYQLVNDCFQEIKLGFLLFAFIGLLLAIILLVVINLSPRYKPKSTMAKVFNTLNFIYIPLLFSLGLGGFGALHFAKKFTLNQVPEKVISSVQFTFVTFQFHVKIEWNDLTNDDDGFKKALNEFSTIVELAPKTDSWFEAQKMFYANKEIKNMIALGYSSTVETEMKRRRITDKTKLEVAKEMSFVKINPDFWEEVELKVLDETKTHFLHKNLMHLVATLIASSFLILQILVIRKGR